MILRLGEGLTGEKKVHKAFRDVYSVRIHEKIQVNTRLQSRPCAQI